MCKVAWTNRAVLSLKNVVDFYINIQGNRKYIDKILKEIKVKEKLISNMPLVGVEVANSPITMRSLRKINVLDYFVLVYRITNKSTIDIIYFWDSRQNPKKLEKHYKSSL